MGIDRVGLPLLRRPRFAVLVYHDVSEEPVKWAVSPRELDAHLRQIRESGGALVSTTQIWEALKGRGRLPARAVCLHFDDARSGFGRAGVEVLRKHRAPATAYVVSGWASGEVPISGEERYSLALSWSEIRELAQCEGMEIGSHGRTHRNLKRLPAAEVFRELTASKAEIEGELGREVRHFASPYNRTNRAIRAAVARAGYLTLSAGGHRVNGLLASAYRIRRFLIPRGFGVVEMDAILSKLKRSVRS